MAAAAANAAPPPPIEHDNILSALRAEYPDPYATSVYDVASKTWIPWAEANEKLLDTFYRLSSDERTAEIAREVLRRDLCVAEDPESNDAPPTVSDYALFVETIDWNVAVAKHTRDIVVYNHSRHAVLKETTIDCVLVVRAEEVYEGLEQLRAEIGGLVSMRDMIGARDRWRALHNSRSRMYADTANVHRTADHCTHLRRFWGNMLEHRTEDLAVEEARVVAEVHATFAAARATFVESAQLAIASIEPSQHSNT